MVGETDIQEQHTEQPRLKDLPSAKEPLAKQHFQYTLVFGQGPVQEKDGIPQSGRKGLNFYSRLVSLAAAEMLEKGITEKLILSGGKTGARTATPEGKTEAELMYDAIKRHITHLSEDDRSYVVLGNRVSRYTEGGEKKTQQQIDTEIHEILKDKILIENKSTDTLANFRYILDTYLDSPGNEDAQVALLGIGFHAHRHPSREDNDVGRLEALAEIFGLGNNVYSAENIITDLMVKNRPEHSSTRTELTRLADVSNSSIVSALKSMQEEILVRGLRGGDWIRAAVLLQNPERMRQAVLQDTFVMDHLKQSGYDRETVKTMPSEVLVQVLSQIRPQGLETYGDVKQRVFDALDDLTRVTRIDYKNKYGKPSFAQEKRIP